MSEDNFNSIVKDDVEKKIDESVERYKFHVEDLLSRGKISKEDRDLAVKDVLEWAEIRKNQMKELLK